MDIIGYHSCRQTQRQPGDSYWIVEQVNFYVEIEMDLRQQEYM